MRRRLLIAIVTAAALLAPASVPCAETAGKLRAGVAKIDITPQTPQLLHTFGTRRTKGVRDPLYHRVLALDDGEKRFYLASSDLLVFSPAYYDEAAARLHAELGVARESFWWSVTHTHAAPSVGEQSLRRALKPERDFSGVDQEYSKLVVDRLVEAVRQAEANLRPASLGMAFGRSSANINRRAKDADGTVFLGINPDGPVDRRITVMRFDGADGQPIATIANYPIHGTVIGAGADYISADAPGIVAEHVEEKTGAPLLFLQGAAGNIAPIYSVEPDAKAGHLTQFIPLLGDRIVETRARAQPDQRSLRFRFSETHVESPRNARIEWPPELAEYSRKSSAGDTLLRVPIRFLQLNQETLIWSAPVELFCEIDFAVRAASPFPYTLYFGYTNGNFGYVPTREAFADGGYEPDAACPFSPEIEDDFRRAVISHIEAMGRR